MKLKPSEIVATIFFLIICFLGGCLYKNSHKKEEPKPSITKEILQSVNDEDDRLSSALLKEQEAHDRDIIRLRDSVRVILSKYKFNPLRKNPVMPHKIDSVFNDSNHCCDQIKFANDAIIYIDSVNQKLTSDLAVCKERAGILFSQSNLNKKAADIALNDNEDLKVIIAERDKKIVKLKKNNRRLLLISGILVAYETIKIAVFHKL